MRIIYKSKILLKALISPIDISNSKARRYLAPLTVNQYGLLLQEPTQHVLNKPSIR